MNTLVPCLKEGPAPHRLLRKDDRFPNFSSLPRPCSSSTMPVVALRQKCFPISQSPPNPLFVYALFWRRMIAPAASCPKSHCDPVIRTGPRRNEPGTAPNRYLQLACTSTSSRHRLAPARDSGLNAPHPTANQLQRAAHPCSTPRSLSYAAALLSCIQFPASWKPDPCKLRVHALPRHGPACHGQWRRQPGRLRARSPAL